MPAACAPPALRNTSPYFHPLVDFTSWSLRSVNSMHVIDVEQAAQLLDINMSPEDGAVHPNARKHGPSPGGVPAARPLRLLDVGAGDGAITAELAPLFSEVLATEVSVPCIRAIRGRGIMCECTSDLSTLGDRRWDVVACLNVLDRCSRPLDLMSDLYRLTEPHRGRVLLAVVLPFRPFVETGAMGRRQAPEQRLPVRNGCLECLPRVSLDSLVCERFCLVSIISNLTPSNPGGLVVACAQLDAHSSWEQSVNEISSRVIRPAGFRILRVSRAPYLCQGDTGSAFYALDDALFVLSPGADLSMEAAEDSG